ncbi:MAG: hypothetical protein WDO13_07220 [Verrucomicrobiota bacterium]
MLHLIVFLLVATLVIWKAPPPPPTSEFHGVTIKVPPPPPQPPSSGAEALNPQFEPQPVVVPVVTPPSFITTADSRSFTVDASKVMDPALSHLSDPMARGTGIGPAGGGSTRGAGEAGNTFGSSTGTGGQLSGYFYDLKQTNVKQPTGMTEEQYLALLAKYVSQGWDDSMLEPYYRSREPLYTDVLAISTRPSEEAPRAFGLEKEVQPGLWVIHYHAKVEAPQEGDYRLAGFADNVMVVKINGETVLDGGWDSLSDKAALHRLLSFAVPSYVQFSGAQHDPHLKIGPTFHLESAQSVDMDVLIGDCGGVCSFFLLIEKEGNTYAMKSDGTPELPFFQLSNKAAPTFTDEEEHPPFSSSPEPWQSAGN